MNEKILTRKNMCAVSNALGHSDFTVPSSTIESLRYAVSCDGDNYDVTALADARYTVIISNGCVLCNGPWVNDFIESITKLYAANLVDAEIDKHQHDMYENVERDLKEYFEGYPSEGPRIIYVSDELTLRL